MTGFEVRSLPILILALLLFGFSACGGTRGSSGGDDDDGASCFTDSECIAGEEYCQADDPSTSPEGSCTPLEAAGSACLWGSQCVSGLFCLVDNTENQGVCSSAPSACESGPSCSCDEMLEMCTPGGMSCDGSDDSVTLNCYNGAAGDDDDDTADDDDDDTADDDDTSGGTSDYEETIACDEGQTADVWQLSMSGGTLDILVDTASAAATFDPASAALMGEDPSNATEIGSGDDENPCTYPPGEYGCPEYSAQGQGTVWILVQAYSGGCNSSGTGGYVLKLSGDGADTAMLAGNDTPVGAE